MIQFDNNSETESKIPVSKLELEWNYYSIEIMFLNIFFFQE